MNTSEQEKHLPDPKDQEDKLGALVQAYVDIGVRLTPSSEAELSEMTVDELYEQLVNHEAISNDWSNSGEVIERKVAHRRLVVEVYVKKVAKIIYWLNRIPPDELATMPVNDSYKLYKETLEWLNNLHFYD